MSNHKSKAAKNADGEVSAKLKMQIIAAVEDRLTKLPAETFKLIQKEVDSRVEIVERYYKRIAWIALGAAAIVMASFFKITADNDAETVAKAIATTEIKKQAVMIEKLLLESQEAKNKLTVVAIDMANSSEVFKSRIRELQKIDNIVTYSATGTLTLKPNAV